MATIRKLLLARALLVGMLFCGVTSQFRQAAAASPDPGSGDPPVIVLPSARSAVMPVQAMQMPAGEPVMPKLELLPPPTPEPPPAAPRAVNGTPAKPPIMPTLEILPPPSSVPSTVAEANPPQAPPLLTPDAGGLQKAPALPTFSSREVVRQSGGSHREAAPMPKPDPGSLAGGAALPTNAIGSKPSPVAPTGESTMMKQATAAALTAMIAGTVPATEMPAQPAAITEIAKAADLMSLRRDVDRLRETVSTLNESLVDQSAIAEVRSLRNEMELLRRDVALIANWDQTTATPDDVKSMREEIAALKSQMANLPTQADARAVKEEVDALRKDVQGLSTLLRELLEGKVEKGFTHDGLTKRLQRLDEALDGLAKKIDALESQTRTAGASPLAKPAADAAVGTVRIVNEYPIEISIAVNGLAYRLEPNSRRDVPVPQGSFRYQLITSGGSETERSIREGETVTLTIR